jgi:hypothetical protein
MKKIIPACILALTMTLTAIPALAKGDSTIPAKDIKFTDISEHWAQSAIVKYADTGTFAGKDGKFFPNQLITRSEFVLMLHKALDIKIKYFRAPDIKEFFDDVSNEDAGALELYDLVVSNTIDRKKSFKPKEALPRDEMIHYIINALKSVTGGNYALNKMMPAPFADDNKIAPAYKNDIVEAVLLKIIYGRGKNMLCPQNGATRAEATVIINKLMNAIEKFTTTVDVKSSVEKDNTSIKLKLSVTNLSGKPVTLDHSSGQKYDFALLDSDRNTLYRWSADKSFILALTTTVIDAEKTVEFTELLDGDAYNSIKDRIKYMTAYIVGTSESFGVNTEGYEVEITE